MFSVVARNGKEEYYEDYEIFCGKRIQWMPNTTPLDRLIPAGKDASGTTTYVCRTSVYVNTYGEQFFSGEYNPKNGCCTTTWLSQAQCSLQFTLMQVF